MIELLGLLVFVIAAAAVNITAADFANVCATVFDFAQFVKDMGGGRDFCEKESTVPNLLTSLEVFNRCDGCAMLQLGCWPTTGQGRVTTMALLPASSASRFGFYVDPTMIAKYVPATISTLLGSFSQLTSLSVQRTDALPSTVALLTNLQSVSFSLPTAVLTTTVGFLSSVLQLTVDGATLLPTQLGRLSKLTQLSLRTPAAVLPSTVSSMTALTSVQLQVQGGSLPASWASLRRVESFDVTSSKLTGSIPLLQFSGRDGACSFRINEFDASVSVCPRGCACDNDIAVQPAATLPMLTLPPVSTAPLSTETTVPAPVPSTVDVVAALADHITTTVAVAAAVIVVVIIAVAVTCFFLLKRRDAQPAAFPQTSQPQQPQQQHFQHPQPTSQPPNNYATLGQIQSGSGSEFVSARNDHYQQQQQHQGNSRYVNF